MNPNLSRTFQRFPRRQTPMRWLALAIALLTKPIKMSDTSVVQGVWSRQWEEDPLGDAENADRTTLVLWTQTPSGIYVDLRLPAGSPGRSSAVKPRASTLAANGYSSDAKHVLSKDPPTLSILLRQKSFAGVLEYSKGDTTSGEALKEDQELKKLADDPSGMALCTCFWRRDIDLQPPTGGLDVGVCASGPPNVDGSILLRETGDDASYAEGWLRQAASMQEPSMALELVDENGTACRRGYWVRAGNSFAYAVGYSDNDHIASQIPKCTGKSLQEAIESLKVDPFDVIGGYVAVAGEIEGDIWKISCSTHPELVGCHLLGSSGDLCCSTLASSDDGHVLQTITGDDKVSRRWKIIDGRPPK